MTKMGRPRKDDAKRASITIRMSKETHKKLNEYASKHELSMTEVALRSLEEYLSKKTSAVERLERERYRERQISDICIPTLTH